MLACNVGGAGNWHSYHALLSDSPSWQGTADWAKNQPSPMYFKLGYYNWKLNNCPSTPKRLPDETNYHRYVYAIPFPAGDPSFGLRREFQTWSGGSNPSCYVHIKRMKDGDKSWGLADSAKTDDQPDLQIWYVNPGQNTGYALRHSDRANIGWIDGHVAKALPQEVKAENLSRGSISKCPLYRFEGQTQCESTYGILTSEYKSPGSGETYSESQIGGLYFKAGSGSIEGALIPFKQIRPNSLILCCTTGQGSSTLLSKALKRLDLPYLQRSTMQHPPFEFYPGLRLDCAVLSYRWSQTFHENLTVSQ